LFASGIYVGAAALNYYGLNIAAFIPEIITNNLEQFEKKETYNAPFFDDIFLKITVASHNGQQWIIYNSAEYELISHKNTYGGLFVVLRFLLVAYYFTGREEYVKWHNRAIKLNRHLLPKTFYGVAKNVRMLHDECVPERDYKPYMNAAFLQSLVSTARMQKKQYCKEQKK
jgi:hypothetical protein